LLSNAEIMSNAWKAGVAIPAFNVPYLPMVEPMIRAVADQDSFAFIATARVEWTKFDARGPDAVIAEFRKWDNPAHVRIHLDHVPVIDEDALRVDFLSIIGKAIDLGYGSVMVDASRLDLAGNIEATRQVAEMAHEAGIPCESELGAVMGHEAGPLPPYEELYESGMGFTDVEEARRFARESGCDWLSVAIGNIHGAVSGVLRDAKKVEARLNIHHLNRLREAAGLPLVLHGGSGVKQEYVLRAIKAGIAKINVGTDIRQAYEVALRKSGNVADAQDAVYERTSWTIRDQLRLAGTQRVVTGITGLSCPDSPA